MIAVVLLIFITIAAAILVFTFILPMIQGGLKDSGECFDALDEAQGISIREHLTYTCFDGTNVIDPLGKEVYLMIHRGQGDFELDKILISISGGGSSQEFSLVEGNREADNVWNYLATADIAPLELPTKGGSKTFMFTGLTLTEVESASYTIVLEGGNTCKEQTALIPVCENPLA